MQPHRAPVAIAGGGPVGMMLALMLARHGVPSVLFNDTRHTRRHPKGSTHNSRTMEHYRRVGLSGQVRRVGLPPAHPRDASYFTRFNAHELARIRLPSELESARAVEDSPATAQVPEPLVRANQMYVDPILHEAVLRTRLITSRFGWTVVDFADTGARVRLHARQNDNGETQVWECDYVAGCDGAHSEVRRWLGIDYLGGQEAETRFLSGRMVSSYIRAPELHGRLLRGAESWLYNIVTPTFRLVVISLDGADEFLVMSKAASLTQLPSPSEVTDTVCRAAGEPIAVEVLASRAWTGGLGLVAQRFAQGRAFIAGDACHLFSPTGGFGMNTGVDGAANLAWKLAAAVQGWAGPDLLVSYELERQPVAFRNTEAARAFTRRVGALEIPDTLEDNSERGRLARQAVGRALQPFRSQFASIGVELGARYDGSPIVHGDGEPPPDNYERYTPSSVPGGRLPHLWQLDKGAGRVSLFDQLGVGFTLLCVGEDAPDAAAFEDAARRTRVPLKVMRLARDPGWELFQRRMVLVRPDQHVAWRGDRLPSDPHEVLQTCVGGPARAERRARHPSSITKG